MDPPETSDRFELRLATADDISCLAAIEQAASAKFSSIPELSDLADGDDMPSQSYREWLSKGPMWVALDRQADGQAVGFLAAYKKDAAFYLAEISVLVEMNGKGVGSLLINQLFEHARQEAKAEHRERSTDCIARVSLFTYPDVPWNGPFYRNRGFKEVSAVTVGPEHAAEAAVDNDKLTRPGFRRCCMLWEDQFKGE